MRKLETMWRPRHGAALPICEMNDSHLLNAVVYVRNVIEKIGDKARDTRRPWVERLAALTYEAGARRLQIDWDHVAPIPKAFKGVAYQKRTVHQEPVTARPFRTDRTLDC